MDCTCPRVLRCTLEPAAVFRVDPPDEGAIWIRSESLRIVNLLASKNNLRPIYSNLGLAFGPLYSNANRHKTVSLIGCILNSRKYFEDDFISIWARVEPPEKGEYRGRILDKGPTHDSLF